MLTPFDPRAVELAKAAGLLKESSPMVSYVAGFLFSPGRKNVVLIKKSGKNLSWMEGLYNAVGGKIEAGESPLTAMVREFQEETGVNGYIDWHPFVRLYCPSVFEVFLFVAESDYYSKCQTFTDEPVFVFSVRLACSIENFLVPNLYWLLPMAQMSNQFAPGFIQIEEAPGRAN